MANGRARVEIQEIDMSTRVPSFPGLYAGIVLQSRKGPVGKAVLCSYETDLLRRYTPNETLEVGDDLAFYSALAFLIKSNKLWVIRAANKPMYGGAILKQSIPVDGLGVEADVDGGSPYTTLIVKDHVKRTLFYESLSTGDKVRVSGTTLPSQFVALTTYYVIKLDKNKLMLASTYQDSLDTNPIYFTTTGADLVLTVFPNEGNVMLNEGVEYGISNPDAYVFDTTSGKELEAQSTFILATDQDRFNVTPSFYNMAVTGDKVRLAASVFPTVLTGAALDAITDYYIIKSDTNETQISRSLSDANLGVMINLTSTGTSVVGTLQDKISNSVVTLNATTDIFTVSASFYNSCATGDAIGIETTGDFPLVDAGDVLDENEEYFVIKGATNSIQLARTLAQASSGPAITFSDAGTGVHTVTFMNKSHTSNFTTDLKGDSLTILEDLYDVLRTGDKVSFSSTGNLPRYEFNNIVDTIQSGVMYYAIRTSDDNKIKVALSYSGAVLGLSLDFLDTGSGDTYIRYNETNEQLMGLEQKAVLIYGSDQGEWNNDIYIETLHYPYGDSSMWITEQEKEAAYIVKEPNCFMIWVYKKEEDGTYRQLEEFRVSRDKSKKDGFGQNVFIEDILERSNYIKAKNNEEVHHSIYPANQTSKLNLVKGDDGFAVTEDIMLKLMSPGSSPLASKRDLKITVLLDGGYAVPSFQKQGMISTCELRKDCVAILSCPVAAELHNDALGEVLNYMKYELNANSSYASIYSSHLYIQDKFNNRKILVSPDGYVGGVISETAANYEIWYPPAGPRRGVLQVLDVAKRWSDGEMDVLTDNNINPIDFYPGKGIRIWGNRTTLTRPSSLGKLNIRLLLITIEPAIAEFLEDFLFEFNDNITRSLVSAGINNYMENIRARRGVYDFRVVCDSSNNTPEDIDNNILNVWLFVEPEQGIELILFKTVISRTGSSQTVSLTNS